MAFNWKKPFLQLLLRQSLRRKKTLSRHTVCIGNSMISSDIWHKYHEWYFKIVIRNFTSGETILKYPSGIYAKYHVQIMLLFVYTTTRKRFVIFACRYFKLSWNTTALSQSNCSNFSCSSINWAICNNRPTGNSVHLLYASFILFSSCRITMSRLSKFRKSRAVYCLLFNSMRFVYISLQTLAC